MAITSVDSTLADKLTSYLCIVDKSFNEFKISTRSQGGLAGPSLCFVNKKDGTELVNLIVARTDRDHYLCSGEMGNNLPVYCAVFFESLLKWRFYFKEEGAMNLQMASGQDCAWLLEQFKRLKG